jgi:ELWxxDGT repeat protein
LVSFDSALYFAASGGLWMSNGTAGGTVLVKAVSGAAHLVSFDSALYFAASGGLWMSDGTAGGTVLVKAVPDFNPGSSFLTTAGSALYFIAPNPNLVYNFVDWDLWKSDGTTAGTAVFRSRILIDVPADGYSMGAVGSTLYFYQVSRHEEEVLRLWRTDGTLAGTYPLFEIFEFDPYVWWSYVSSLVPASSSAHVGLHTDFFVADDPISGRELWWKAPVLTVEGTDTSDSILVSPPDNLGIVTIRVNGGLHSTNAEDLWARINIYAFGANDDIQVTGSSVTVPLYIYGGAGNDRLKGGDGHDVLLGEDGDDLLVGGGGRDLLIGGLGADKIVGNGDDDILIAGTTGYDFLPIGLVALMREWTGGNSYADRVHNVFWGFGQNGTFAFYYGGIYNDTSADVLTGSAGNDWFIYDQQHDRVTDLNDEAFINDLAFIGQ